MLGVLARPERRVAGVWDATRPPYSPHVIADTAKGQDGAGRGVIPPGEGTFAVAQCAPDASIARWHGYRVLMDRTAALTNACLLQTVTLTSQMLVARKMAPFIQKVTLWSAQTILHNLHYKVLEWEKGLATIDPWNAAALRKLAEQILAGVTHKYGNVGFGMVISEILQAIYDELVGADASFAKVKKRSEKLAKKARRAAENPTGAIRPWDGTETPMWVQPPPYAADTGVVIPRKHKEVSPLRAYHGIGTPCSHPTHPRR